MPDALGETYSRSFALSSEQRRSGSDVLVLATLLSEGDPCDEARDIDYVLTFSDEAQTVDAADALQAAGFRLHDTDRSANHLVIVDHAVPEPARLAEFRRRILEAAEAWSPDYDGWGCEAQRPQWRGLFRQRRQVGGASPPSHSREVK
ncbi:MAG: ribonuclease E inhibitor RraB [Candidatus Microthrix parvicella]